MADRSVFSDHEDGFFCKTCIRSQRRQGQSTLSHLFPESSNISASGKEARKQYTCEQLLDTLKSFDFASLEDQGFMPLYRRTKLTDILHETCGFRTDFQFITKRKMKEIQKKSKGKE